MARKTKENTYTQRDVAAVLNNAVLRSLHPTRLGKIDPKRLQDLREYALALIEPTQEHLGEKLLAPEELVAVFSICALFIQLAHVMKTDKIPMAKEVKNLMGGEDE